MKDVSHIHFYGHSFADVDLPYFRKTFRSVDKKRVNVEANAHSEEDKEAISRFMSFEGITNYRIISLNDVLISRHWYWRLGEWLRVNGSWLTVHGE